MRMDRWQRPKLPIWNGLKEAYNRKHEYKQTEIRCKPHNSQSSLSLASRDDHVCNTICRGRTLSVMMYMLLSVSTASMNLRTSGCRVVLSFRSAFVASGLIFFVVWSLKSYSNMDTRLPSSWVDGEYDPERTQLVLVPVWYLHRDYTHRREW